MSDEVRVNGNQISWSSFKLKIEGVPYSGITGVEFADSRERTFAYGMGRHHAPRGRTAGKYTPEPLVLTAYTSTSKAIRDELAQRAQAGRGLGSVSSTVVLQYVEPDDATVTIELQDCALTKIEASTEEGTDALTEKLTFSVMRILRDGLALHDGAA